MTTQVSSTLTVEAINEQWTSTNVQLHKGDEIHIRAEGSISVHPMWESIGPEGLGYLPAEFDANLEFLFPSLAHYALVAKIGNDGEPFVVGKISSHSADVDGALSFWINETNGIGNFTDNTGAFTVTVETVRASAPVVSSATAPDDLTRIEGIGPQIAALLQSNGITTFTQLAASTVEQLRTLLLQGGKKFTIADPSTWAQQASLAAAGSWEAFKKLQSELKAGRK